MVLPAARNLASVCGLVCVNGFYDALRVQRAVRSVEDWERFFAWLQEERREVTHSSEPRRTDPFWIYPLDSVSKGYVDSVLRAVPGYEGDTVHTAFADSLLDFSPERDLGHLSELAGADRPRRPECSPSNRGGTLPLRSLSGTQGALLDRGLRAHGVDERRRQPLQAARGQNRRLVGRAVSPDELLVGAWDVHVHAAPGNVPRPVDLLM